MPELAPLKISWEADRILKHVQITRTQQNITKGSSIEEQALVMDKPAG